MYRRELLAASIVGITGCTSSALSPTSVKEECRGFRDAEKTVCQNGTGGPTTGVYMAPDTPTVERETLSQAFFPVVLHNNSEVDFRFSPPQWTLYLHTGDGWKRIAPTGHFVPGKTLPPGERVTYKLTTKDDPPGEQTQVLATVEPGVYAFTNDGTLMRRSGRMEIETIAFFRVTDSWL